MSTLRNSVQRRNHKERSQPEERSKWGLLEKHKDYTLRAKDYNAKKTKLKHLRQKAEERNPDEFTYSMLSTKTKKGRKVTGRGNPVLDHTTVKLLKTQDRGYLQTILSSTLKDIERVRNRVILDQAIDSSASELKSKIKFVDETLSASSRQNQLVNTESHLRLAGGVNGDVDMDVDVDEETVDSDHENHNGRPDGRQESERRMARLERLREREKSLKDALRELDHQRARISSTTGGTNSSGVKWKVRERKK